MTGSNQTTATPRSVVVLIAALAGVGLGGAALDAARHGGGHVDWPWVAPFVALLVVGGYIVIRFKYGEQVESLDLFEAVLAPVLFASAGWSVVAMVCVANIIAELLHRDAPVKAAFNVAQWMAAAATGALVLDGLRQGPGLTWHNAGSLAVALVAMMVVNHLALSAVLALAQGQSLVAVVRGLRSLILPGWVIGGALNLAFGFLFVAAYQSSPAASLLFAVPLLALGWAERGYAAARGDEARLRSLHKASALLNVPVDPLDAVSAFLDEVRACFEAEAAELLIIGDGPGGEITVHHSPAGASGKSPWPLGTLLKLEAPARLAAATNAPDGWRDCLAAPLRDGDETIGLLCTYNRTGLEGFEEGELAVLGALADDVVGALQKGRLVRQVIDERKKLADIVDNTSDGILTLAADGTVSTWNPAFESVTGWRASEVLGTTHVSNLRPRDPEGRDVLIERWAASDVALPELVQILTRGGDVRWLACSYNRMTGAGDGAVALIVVARDITQAHELEQLKEDFVATVSHELRTPLAPIKGWASTLLEHGAQLDDDQRRQGMESILRHASRLEGLVVNLLEASKIEHGRVVDVDDHLDIVPIVSRVIDGFQASWPDRLFVLDGVDRSWQARGNEMWVEQILTNLVSNAVKYSPTTAPVGVTITGSGDSVEIAVDDHGAGIPKAELERIFDRFHRLQETGTQTGTGLGLYIARQLAAEIGGTISVTSTEGAGSRFTLRLRDAARLAPVA